MFSVERLTKCRTSSGSVNSTSGGGAEAKARRGSSSSSGLAGTSQAGNCTARRPGDDNSKIN